MRRDVCTVLGDVIGYVVVALLGWLWVSGLVLPLLGVK